MARATHPWFRFYVEAFSDVKVRRLPYAHRWLWAAVMGAARQSKTPGSLLVAEDEPMTLDDIADFAAVTLKETKAGMAMFERQGMVHRDGDTWVVTHWKERQYESDLSTERTARHRSKERSDDVSVTLSESREQKADTELLTRAAELNPRGVDNSAAAPDLSIDVIAEQALVLIAERRVQAKLASPSGCSNPAGYRASTVAGLRHDYAASIVNLDPAEQWTPQLLADWLEPPPPPPKPAEPHPLDATAAAAAAIYERNDARLAETLAATRSLTPTDAGRQALAALRAGKPLLRALEAEEAE